MSIKSDLVRQLGLMGLVATGVCSMMGASINVVPFMIQRNVEGIGPYVLPAFMVAALPALLAAMAYAALASAMPRAGGSYIYASRGLHPYLGFIGSFSQWFGLSIVIGVIAYIVVPFLRDICTTVGWEYLGAQLEVGWVRVLLSLCLIWLFVYINVRGVRLYEKTLVPLMMIMFALGSVVIFSGFSFDHNDFEAALQSQEGRDLPLSSASFDWQVFFSAAALMFSSFIGFDSIAQAGGEAKRPSINLPRAIILAITIVGSFYFLFTAAVYHAVPWAYIAQEAATKDISAPGLLTYLLPTGLSVMILVGATIALINDLPAMLLSVSRLVFAWAKDGVFPKRMAQVHPTQSTPYMALYVCGLIASVGVLGCHFAGDFFLGVDIMLTSMMVNFLLMCMTLLYLPNHNPELGSKMSVLKGRGSRILIGGLGVLLITLLLMVHTAKDIGKEVEAWYYHSTWIWLIVMLIGTVIYGVQYRKLKQSGIDVKQLFKDLPEE